MPRRRISHVVGFDDAPFPKDHHGDVLVVGAVYSGLTLQGVLSGRVRRDGANAARTMAQLISRSRFAPHLQAVLLQGIALAGFNVVDMHWLHQALDLPVIAVARKAPDMEAVKRALLTRVRGGRRKWALIERLGAMEPIAGVFVQKVGLDLADVEDVVLRLAVNGAIPEPLRAAHLIAGGIASGESRGRT